MSNARYDIHFVDVKQEIPEYIDVEETNIKLEPEEEYWEERTFVSELDDNSEENELVHESLTCQYCNKVFSVRRYFDTHQRVCRARYLRKIHRDVKLEEEIEEQKHKCPECKYQSNNLQYLKRHMYIHSGERPFKCTYCDYGTTQKGALQRHVTQIHTKEILFKCDLCNYQSGAADNFQKHKRVHMKQKPFVCKVCNKSYTLLDSLQYHMYKHNGKEKPIKCDECNYSTLKVGHLKVHKSLKHSNDRPFACNLCEYKSATSGQMNRHTKRHIKRIAVKKETET